MGGFSKNWCHMRKAYPVWICRQPTPCEAWKTAPVAWETCWDMRKWVDEGWSLRFIFNYALALHGSVHQQQVGTAARGRERSARGRAIPAAARLPPRAEGTEAPRRRSGLVAASSWP